MQSSATEFLKPRHVDVQALGPTHAKITLEPLERGFGYTLGNALRRILLSSMPGCAVTEVKIEGVLHEYSTLGGRAGRRDRNPAEPQESGAAHARARRNHAQAQQEGRGQGHRRRHPARARRRGGGPESPDRHAHQGREHQHGAQNQPRSRLRAGDGAQQRRGGPGHRHHAARRLLQPGPARGLHRRERARGAAHRPRQAGAGHRNQRHDQSGRGRAPRGEYPQQPDFDLRRPQEPRRPRPRRRRRRTWTRCCCARWTTWN